MFDFHFVLLSSSTSRTARHIFQSPLFLVFREHRCCSRFSIFTLQGFSCEDKSFIYTIITLTVNPLIMTTHRHMSLIYIVLCLFE